MKKGDKGRPQTHSSDEGIARKGGEHTVGISKLFGLHPGVWLHIGLERCLGKTCGGDPDQKERHGASTR